VLRFRRRAESLGWRVDLILDRFGAPAEVHAGCGSSAAAGSGWR
jgi:hypothetical protein